MDYTTIEEAYQFVTENVSAPPELSRDYFFAGAATACKLILEASTDLTLTPQQKAAIDNIVKISNEWTR